MLPIFATEEKCKFASITLQNFKDHLQKKGNLREYSSLTSCEVEVAGSVSVFPGDGTDLDGLELEDGCPTAVGAECHGDVDDDGSRDDAPSINAHQAPSDI
ncbi:unnamed protein product [Cylicostephanus goldi]|uniref:Uncharacterized protein n=1 Tax=Cylicostephanus goldi TaxID=71465 RepID=A0A3P7PTM5_CYLGO|nr:unnamed protein product [Cylicostephanus goldi]